MKKIEAIIKPFKLDDVREALSQIGITGMTVGEVRGVRATEGAYRALSRGGIRRRFSTQGKIRNCRSEDQIDACIETITDAARTGKIGDGKIFVTDVEKVVRIRTGEEDEDAI